MEYPFLNKKPISQMTLVFSKHINKGTTPIDQNLETFFFKLSTSQVSRTAFIIVKILPQTSINMNTL